MNATKKMLISFFMMVCLKASANAAHFLNISLADTTLPLETLSVQKIKTFSLTPEVELNKKRLFIVTGSSGVALGGSFIYLNNAWWSGDKRSFHFDGGKGLKHMFTLGNDWRYAKNLDKIGHLWGGALSASLLSNSLQWAGLRSGKEYLWSGVMGTAIQGFIEYKDGFAPRWGFSIYDMLTGAFGSFYPYLQAKNKFFAALDFKFSYYKRNDYYKNITGRSYWNDDYINQTYWLSFNPRRYNDNLKWPKWLAVSVGFGVDDRLNNYYLLMPNGEDDFGKGGYELFIAPDLDLMELLPKKRLWQKAAKVLNFIKIPAPTIRISKKSTFFPVYF